MGGTGQAAVLEEALSDLRGRLVSADDRFAGQIASEIRLLARELAAVQPPAPSVLDELQGRRRG